MNLKNERVFRETKTGLLEFVGDFDGLYEDEPDPWGQSGRDGSHPLNFYYEFSRSRLISLLNKRTRRSVPGLALEVGCGLGYVVDRVNKFVPMLKMEGMDVSQVAISKACKLFPRYRFEHGDIRSLDSKWQICQNRYKVIVLNQVLWYVLEKMQCVLENCHHLLSNDGILVISQSFLNSKQRYGAEIADGVHGFLLHLQTIQSRTDLFSLIEFEYDDTMRYIHHDGLLTFRKTKNGNIRQSQQRSSPTKAR